MKLFAFFALTFAAGVHLNSDPVPEHLLPPKKKTEAEPVITYNPYKASDNGKGGYERVIPERFSTDADDTFMRSVITKYAVETRDKEGKPTGKFYLDKAGAKELAAEVVKTFTGKKGAEVISYLDKVFESNWERADVNGEGKIEVERTPPLMRNIIGNQQANLQLAIKK